MAPIRMARGSVVGQRQALVVYPRPKHRRSLRRPNGEVGDQQVAMSIEGREQRVVVGSWVLEVRESGALAAVRRRTETWLRPSVSRRGCRSCRSNRVTPKMPCSSESSLPEHRRRRPLEMNQLHRRRCLVVKGTCRRPFLRRSPREVQVRCRLGSMAAPSKPEAQPREGRGQ